MENIKKPHTLMVKVSWGRGVRPLPLPRVLLMGADTDQVLNRESLIRLMLIAMTVLLEPI